MEEPLNLAHPSSVGALLAEEWTIDPYSTLPSFLEMVMTDEAARSGITAVGVAIDAIEVFLARRLRVWELDDDDEDETEGDNSLFRRSSYLQQLRYILRKCRTYLTVSSLRLIRRHKLEIQYLSIYALERQSLQSNSATIAESLHGGRRVKLGSIVSSPNGTQQGNAKSLLELSQTDTTRVALLTALIPYINERLQRWTQQRHSEQKFALPAVYPVIRVIMAAVDLMCRWRYLMGRSVHFDMTLLLLQQVVRRVTQADSGIVSPPDNVDAMGEINKDGQVERPETAVQHMPDSTSLLSQSVLYMITGSLAVSWLTQIRHEWNTYYQNQMDLNQRQTSSGNDHQFGLSSVPPPPPGLVLPATTSIRADLCPLCRLPRTKPTATTSGYVFCLSCVLPYVQQHGRCPITGRPCTPKDLIRLYEPVPKVVGAQA